MSCSPAESADSDSNGDLIFSSEPSSDLNDQNVRQQQVIYDFIIYPNRLLG